jgi:hypothetical protein
MITSSSFHFPPQLCSPHPIPYIQLRVARKAGEVLDMDVLKDTLSVLQLRMDQCNGDQRLQVLESLFPTLLKFAETEAYKGDLTDSQISEPYKAKEDGTEDVSHAIKVEKVETEDGIPQVTEAKSRSSNERRSRELEAAKSR